MTLRIILAPLLGAVIGYITNDIAIKMLFRPRRALYIGRWKAPFTPGLIPQQKDRIAASIGSVVSGQLLDESALREAVLSEGAVNMLREQVIRFLDSFSDCEDTVDKTGSQLLGVARFEQFVGAAEVFLEELLLRKLRESEIGAEIVRYAMNRLRESLRIGSNSPLFNQLMAQMEAALGSAIQEVIIQMAPDLVHNELHNFFEETRDTRLCDLHGRYKDRIPDAADAVVLLYRRLLGENLGKILRAVDVAEIIRQKIAAFDAVQLEALIFGIMRRELRAIVYLGALLGFLMGLLSLLFL